MDDVRRRLLEGQTPWKIGQALGISESTIRGHVKRTIQPQWAASIADRLAVEVAKVEYLESVAWERFHASCAPTTTEDLKHELLYEEADGKKKKRRKVTERLVERAVKTVTTSGTPAWLQIVVWCREWFARVGGLYVTKEDPAAATREVLPVILVKIKTREEAKGYISYQEMRERLARDAGN